MKKGFQWIACVIAMVTLFAGTQVGALAAVPTTASVVATGDNIPYFIIGAVVIVCIAVIAVLLIKKKSDK